MEFIIAMFILIAIGGTIYFYKTKGKAAAIGYGIYATAIILIFSLFVLTTQ